ncbi:cell envelope biogenesis protein OmpA [Providencia huaxiensis]|uniref:Cell envelope biogenesis protein OmpA n=1 Tax=Providencia huaxiensis TaxID=2027290 RepID=A0A8I2IPF2_9GAMM|nr:cell envelope biogenesis protein OmpA [Providencia huaxiensis]MBQ0269418.1 cell envelope biogenesis protein OmpA [Providencia huaxiensis]
MRKVYGVAIILCVIALSGCMKNNGLHGYNKESWNNKNTLKEYNVVNDNKALVLFYRLDNQVKGKTINIFVNNEYLTSLESNSVKGIELCAGRNNLTAHKTDVKERYNTKLNSSDFFQLDAGKKHLFLIVEVDGKTKLRAMDEKELSDIKGNISVQSHTLSRVDMLKDCQ